VSRSVRHTPICGNTIADSDKRFKAAEHRRERRTVRTALPHDDLPGPKRFGNPWSSAKDGKHWFGDAPLAAKLMRK
jgi:hypothetical protein